MKKIGVYVGRFNPIHKGHERMIDTMLKNHGDDHLLIYGSAQEEGTLRHPLTLNQRQALLHTLYPRIRSVSLFDCDTDEKWRNNLVNVIKLAADATSVKKGLEWEDDDVNAVHPIFYGGSYEDLQIYEGYTTQLVSRFDDHVSSSEVKDALIYGRDIEHLVNDKIIHTVQAMFAQFWENRYE